MPMTHRRSPGSPGVSDDAWRYYVNALGAAAIVVTALLIVAVSRESSGYEREASDRSYQYARNAERQIAAYCGPRIAGDPAKCKDEAAQAAREYQRKEQDLAAQKVTAWWTAVMGGAAVAGVILSAFGIFLVYRTFRTTQEANALTRQSMELQHRPLLVFDRCEFRALNDDTDLARVYWVNRGSLPARTRRARAWKTMSNAFHANALRERLIKTQASAVRDSPETIMGGQEYVMGEFALHRPAFTKGHAFVPLAEDVVVIHEGQPWTVIVTDLEYSAAFGVRQDYQTKFSVAIEPVWEGDNPTGEYRTHVVPSTTELS